MATRDSVEFHYNLLSGAPMPPPPVPARGRSSKRARLSTGDDEVKACCLPRIMFWAMEGRGGRGVKTHGRFKRYSRLRASELCLSTLMDLLWTPGIGVLWGRGFVAVKSLRWRRNQPTDICTLRMLQASVTGDRGGSEIDDDGEAEEGEEEKEAAAARAEEVAKSLVPAQLFHLHGNLAQVFVLGHLVVPWLCRMGACVRVMPLAS